jgi:hypothetical protein
MQGILFVTAVMALCGTQEYMRRTIKNGARAGLGQNVKFYDAPYRFRSLHPSNALNFAYKLLLIAVVVLSVWGITEALLAD